MINCKNLLKKTCSLFTALLILFSPAAVLASHDTKEPYGHFGQPHELVVSGEFTFIVEVIGRPEITWFSIYKSSATNPRQTGVFNGTATSVTEGVGGANYYNLVWDSTGVEDGDYVITGDLDMDGIIYHYNGKEFLSFKVDNPDPPATPSDDTSAPDPTCETSLSTAKDIANDVYDKHSNNLTFIDNFFQQTTLFYEKNDLGIEGHEETLNDIAELRKRASDSVVRLKDLKDFKCGDMSLKGQVDYFVEESRDTRNFLDNYKDATINLMLGILEAL